MNVEEIDGLRAGLHELAELPQVPVGADVEAARARGRRVILGRRAGAVAGAGLAVGAVVLGSVAVLPSGGSKAMRPEAQSSSSTARPNPWVAKASFGWLPTGYGAPAVTFQDGIFGLSSVKGTAASGSQFSLSVFPAGPEPGLGNMRNGVPSNPIAAPSVAGRPAHWLQPPPPGAGTAPGEARLRFEYGDHRWAELELDAAPAGTDIRAVVYKVASSVRFQDRPVAFPIRITGLPVSFKPMPASVSTNPLSGIGWETDLAFGPGLQITVTRHGTAPRIMAPRKPNTTVDGYPAFRSTAGAGQPMPAGKSAQGPKDRIGFETLCVFGVKGLDVCFMSQPQATQALKASGGLTGLVQRTKSLGPDPSTWTTDPLG
jgi:hypothetical protein